MADSTPNFDIYYPEQVDVTDNLVPHFSMLAQSVDDAFGVNTQEIQDYITSLFQSSGVRVSLASNWTVPNPPETVRNVPFSTTSRVRGSNPPTLSTSTRRITVRAAGLYLAAFKANVTGNPTYARQFNLTVNEESIIPYPTILDVNVRRASFTFPLELQENDQVWVTTFGGSGGTGSVVTTATTLDLTRIGPINIG